MSQLRAIAVRLFVVMILVAPAAADDGVAGRWIGTTTFAPNAALPTEFRFAPSKEDSSTWTGIICQPTGGIPHMPFTSVTVTDKKVVGELDLNGGAFHLTCTAELSADDSNTLTGNMVVRGRNATYPFSLVRTPMPEELPDHRRFAGNLIVPGQKVPWSVVLARRDRASWLGTLSVPLQQMIDVTITTITVDGRKVKFEVVFNARAVQVFEGEFVDASEMQLKGTMTLNGQPTGTWELEAGGKAMARPQEPKGPFPYRIEQVEYKALENQGGFKLAGTLTIPEGEGRFPCVVLINGSGLHDRNSEMLGHKPFWVIADYLARHGIAALRYDERSVGQSGGDATNATSDDLADDVAAGIDFLKSHELIDGEHIGVAGHSEGSTIAAITASTKRPDDVSFVVLLAGPGQAGRVLVLAQLEAIMKAQGAPAGVIESSVRYKAETLAAVLDEGLEGQVLRLRVISALAAHYARLIAIDPTTQQISDEELGQAADAEIAGLANPWVRFFFSFDPADALAKVTCPVLALNGTKDVQVPWDLCLPAIFKALVASGNTDVTIRALPGLNHLFQHCDTGLISEYSEIEETFAPEALRAMGDWIAGQAR
ncbi:MAG: alpha/beta hydrolase family protein [Planctomycetota bacterium]